MNLVLERKGQQDETQVFGNGIAMASPLVHEDYWVYRVRLSETQAIVGFPKYGIIGIGFAVESDWNLNFPSSMPAHVIFDHIGRNKGDDSISDADVLEAIKMVQAAVRAAKEDE